MQDPKARSSRATIHEEPSGQTRASTFGRHHPVTRSDLQANSQPGGSGNGSDPPTGETVGDGRSIAGASGDFDGETAARTAIEKARYRTANFFDTRNRSSMVSPFTPIWVDIDLF